MQAYKGLTALYGDLHNHCHISYGHGSLEAAFDNAREQLDFCSVTGHAIWPDMPKPDKEIQAIVDFHKEGFARLRKVWSHVQEVTENRNKNGEFVTFLGFEMHSCADGDYTILYKDSRGDILEVCSWEDLQKKLKALKKQDIDVIAFPHHIAYKKGQRGINWSTFNEEYSPVIELISMHGCSESSESARPYLHSMGALDYKSTMQYGLTQGHFFGIIGSTDHHSAYPGSYGHGRTGLWARDKSRDAVWDALCKRQTYALTGDRIELKFSINDQLMGSKISHTNHRHIEIHVVGGGAIDYLDILKNGKMIHRVSECDIVSVPDTEIIRTKVFLELGWGNQDATVNWDVRFGISSGKILSMEPRFRGQEVLSPLDKKKGTGFHTSHWEADGNTGVHFTTKTFGNPNSRTNASQGFCLEVEMPVDEEVRAIINGRKVNHSIRELLEGTRSGRLSKTGSPNWCFHRAPKEWEFNWRVSFDDITEASEQSDVYYVRVKQKNDEWAWSSPIMVKRDEAK